MAYKVLHWELKITLTWTQNQQPKLRNFHWTGERSIANCTFSVRVNYNLKSHKNVCITPYQPDTKYNPNANRTAVY